jgi:septal ring factor EnvC (AmiA/AmiB activator)
MADDSLFNRVTSIAALVRDVGVIIGLPVILTVGIKLYDLQTKALESQMKAVEAQNDVLKQTQYDRALALMKSQRELFDNERAALEKERAALEMKVANLSTSEKDQSEELNRLTRRIAELDEFKRKAEEAKEAEAKNIQTMVEMLILSSREIAKEVNSRQKK